MLATHERGDAAEDADISQNCSASVKESSFQSVRNRAFHLTHVHNRMPVILEPRDYNRWLERVDGERPQVDLLRPFPASAMRVKQPHKDMGNVRKNQS